MEKKSKQDSSSSSSSESSSNSTTSSKGKLSDFENSSNSSESNEESKSGPEPALSSESSFEEPPKKAPAASNENVPLPTFKKIPLAEKLRLAQEGLAKAKQELKLESNEDAKEEEAKPKKHIEIGATPTFVRERREIRKKEAESPPTPEAELSPFSPVKPAKASKKPPPPPSSSNSSESTEESTQESTEESSSSAPSTEESTPSTKEVELPIPEVSRKLWGKKEPSAEKLLELWMDYIPKTGTSPEDTKRIFKERNVLIQKMLQTRVFPEEEEKDVEQKGWLYPDIKDPAFLSKILEKREFADSLQSSMKERVKRGDNPCSQTDDFELTPVQRFVSNFLAPTTPYQSVLLYHGVGVGKTCAAVTIAESFLEKYPGEQVYVIAPTAIQAGFKNEIFDISAIRMGKGIREENLLAEPNQLRGCTGDLYLKLTGTLFEQDKAIIQRRVNELIKQRYQFYGYLQLANQIEAIEKQIKGINVEGRRDIVDNEIRKRFNGRVLIIDEAHNLRNAGEEAGENLDSPGGEDENNLASEGKKLIPYLKRILTVCEGIRLVLLTGTPMYNSYKEIIFLMNLMLMNEKRSEDMISEAEIFDKDGGFKENGAKKLGKLAQRYVSFMRGEDPLRYPIRLQPKPIDDDIEVFTDWPNRDPKGEEIDEEELERIQNFNLPLIKCEFSEKVQQKLYDYSKEFVKYKGIQFATVDALIQAGNWIFPKIKEDDELKDRVLKKGFCNVFESNKPYCKKATTAEKAEKGAELRFKSKIPPEKWLAEDELYRVSPKMKVLLQRLRTCKGCAFVYSRFVNAGSLPIAIALEANGYKPYGRDTTFLVNDAFPSSRLQCALCEKRKGEHREGDGHAFVQARYALMTGSQELSPNNAKIIKAQKLASKPKTDKEEAFVGNEQGAIIKVIIGTKVAAEGIDFKYMREMFLFDGWYHLSKLEQVIGRGVRTCSHALLPKAQRNTTIYLLVNVFEKNRETMDLWSYRKAINKAAQVGKVTRVLKEYAMDCNLNHDAILISGLDPITMEDSQGQKRKDVNINDVPYTILCDWEKCDTFKCRPQIEVEPDEAGEETYTEFAAKWQEHRLLNAVRKLFEGRSKGDEQAFIGLDDFNEAFMGISRKSRNLLLQTILRSKSFRIRLFDKEGTIIYKNGYFLFQPLALADEGIPLAMRMASYPLKRDTYIPIKFTGIAPALPPPPTATVKEGTVAAVKPSKDATVELWKELLKYTDTIRNRTALKRGVSGDIEAALEAFHNYHAANINKSKYKFEVMSWFYTQVRENEEYRKILADIVEESVWDEFLTPTQQMSLLEHWKSSKDGMTRNQHVYVENHLKKDALEAFRFVDIASGKLQFLCGTRECNPSEIERLSTNPPNTLADLPALTRKTTGPRYGFIMPSAKAEGYIFKTAEPPAEGSKTLEKGQECANNSKTTQHKEKIVALGKILEATIQTNFNLTMDDITIENAVRICYLMSLVLRWMDKKKIGGKRWMYRTVSTFLVGYGTAEKKGKKK
jgi:hypothetical protein